MPRCGRRAREAAHARVAVRRGSRASAAAAACTRSPAEPAHLVGPSHVAQARLRHPMPPPPQPPPIPVIDSNRSTPVDFVLLQPPPVGQPPCAAGGMPAA
eukprot:2755343-Prymnesium_polylepis.1